MAVSEETGVMRGRGASRHTALIAAGLALSVGGLTLLLAPGEPVAAEAGTVLDAPLDPQPPRPTPAATGTGSPPPRDSPAAVPPAPQAASRGFVPERLVLATLDVDAPLVTTVVDTEGAFVPPEDPAELGWWRGVRPGEGEGSVLVAGHIDSRRYGQGPLARIVELRPGDRAVLLGDGGLSAEYVVRGVQTFPKESLPAGDLFSADGAERLVLVTCGGTFDRERGGWDSNVVAVLDPVPPR